jgi:DNA (cytosine-5)-methyltransferase 1
MSAGGKMDRRPRLLDLFSGAGGAGMGYHRAGFEVVGVDIKVQPHYPFEFHQGDALDFCREHWHEFDAIHASPPCQAYSVATLCRGKAAPGRHPDLVAETRAVLRSTDCPYIIENVPRAPLEHPIILCGTMFGLRVLRHRAFEGSIKLVAPKHIPHPKGVLTNSQHRYSDGTSPFVCVAGHNFSAKAGPPAMGIDWMKNRHELAQAVPPAYTEFIGKQLVRALK